MATVTPRGFFKTVASSATPEVLGEETTHMLRPVFIGRKTAATVNTGTVTIQVKNLSGDFIDLLTLTSDEERTWPVDGFYKASDFKIKVETNGDGVGVAFGTI